MEIGYCLVFIAAVIMLLLMCAVRFFPHFFLPKVVQPPEQSIMASSVQLEVAKLADLAAHAPVPGIITVQQLPLGALPQLLRGEGAGEKGCLVLLGVDSCRACQVQFGELNALLKSGHLISAPSSLKYFEPLSRTTLVVVENSALGTPEHAELLKTISAATTSGKFTGIPMWLVVRPKGKLLRAVAGVRKLKDVIALAQEVLS